MKTLLIACTLVLVAFLSTRPGDRAAAARGANPGAWRAGWSAGATSPGQGVEAIEVGGDPLPSRQWFPPLAELLADPTVNANAVVLSEADAQRAALTLAQASADLDAIEARFSEAQAVIARRHVEQGRAAAFVPGESDTSLGDSAAVVVTRLGDGSGPWIARIDHAELPQLPDWKRQVETTRAHALDVLRQLLAATGAAAPSSPR
jgi:hypothetical protein